MMLLEDCIYNDLRELIAVMEVITFKDFEKRINFISKKYGLSVTAIINILWDIYPDVKQMKWRLE